MMTLILSLFAVLVQPSCTAEQHLRNDLHVSGAAHGELEFNRLARTGSDHNATDAQVKVKALSAV